MSGNTKKFKDRLKKKAVVRHSKYVKGEKIPLTTQELRAQQTKNGYTFSIKEANITESPHKAEIRPKSIPTTYPAVFSPNNAKKLQDITDREDK